MATTADSAAKSVAAALDVLVPELAVVPLPGEAESVPPQAARNVATARTRVPAVAARDHMDFFSITMETPI
ncbi:hypothetical protein [Frankia sp. Cr2]|uniref:hypothetical protein n=1 Tax=Frankia sp. Cr2 TaxID=3073932 RepID=UPI002AD265B7|nr:hypothetical protein [Frankia sp. Cr2]